MSCTTGGVTLALDGRLECSGEYSITQEDIDSGTVSGSWVVFENVRGVSDTPSSLLVENICLRKFLVRLDMEI